MQLFLVFVLSPSTHPILLLRNPVGLPDLVTVLMLSHRTSLQFWGSFTLKLNFCTWKFHFTSILESSAWDDKTEVFINLCPLLFQNMLFPGNYSPLSTRNRQWLSEKMKKNGKRVKHNKINLVINQSINTSCITHTH